MRVGEVSLDAQGLTGTLTNSYIDIRYEGKYIDTFKVGNASFIKSVEYLTEGNDRIARVYLNELDSTTSVTFSYTMNFKKGLTPKGYEVSANVSWKQEDGTVIKEATGDATFRVKTLDMNVLKLPGNDYYSYDDTRQYGGTSNEMAISIIRNMFFSNSVQTLTMKELGIKEIDSWKRLS